MSVDIRNSEGYLDPTPYQAFLEIEHDEHRALRAFRPIVYICSPYTMSSILMEGDHAREENRGKTC